MRLMFIIRNKSHAFSREWFRRVPHAHGALPKDTDLLALFTLHCVGDLYAPCTHTTSYKVPESGVISATLFRHIVTPKVTLFPGFLFPSEQLWWCAFTRVSRPSGVYRKHVASFLTLCHVPAAVCHFVMNTITMPAFLV